MTSTAWTEGTPRPATSTDSTDGRARSHSGPAMLLRVEGLAVFAVATVAYFAGGGSAALYFALLLVPDLSLLGYLAGKRAGAVTYNAAHNYLVPIAAGAIGHRLGAEVTVLVALIWAAHVGIDRTAGFGLKYARSFMPTHLQRV